MTVRIKTVEYAFPSRNTNLTLNTDHNFAAITIYLPETTSRTFRSVRLIQFARHNEAASTNSMGTVKQQVKLGAAAFSTLTFSAPANTGESYAFFFEADVTSYFTSNFGTGTSQTCQVRWAAASCDTINIGAKLVITYEYDDAASTHVKTVKIPLDSGLGALTATLAEIGTNQIPALDTFLPETSKTYRNIWFELYYNETTAGTANDASLGMQVDSGTEHLTGVHESALASSPMGFYIWDQGSTPAWATNAVHAFKLRSSTITTASTFNHVGILLCVTYEYAANSSSIINSLELVFPDINHPDGGAAADAARTFMDLWIEEPGTIAQVQSGVLMSYHLLAAVSPVIVVGSGTARTYTDTDVLQCGPSFMTQRCDSGGAGGSAWTLARGRNRLYLDVYQSAVGMNLWAFCPILFLNYTSGNDGNGGSRHNQSMEFNLYDTTAAATNAVMSAAPQMSWLPDSEWFLNNLGIINRGWHNNTGVEAIMLRMEAASGELAGDNFYAIANWGHMVDAEIMASYRTANLDQLNIFDRWANDPDTERLSLTAARRFSYSAPTHWNRCLCAKLTRHAISFAVAGTISGSSGGTVTIEAYTERFGLVGSTSRVGNGTYSIPWYDNTETGTKVWARESASLVGASEEAAAGT